jgi:hypothetical protein
VFSPNSTGTDEVGISVTVSMSEHEKINVNRMIPMSSLFIFYFTFKITLLAF